MNDRGSVLTIIEYGRGLVDAGVVSIVTLQVLSEDGISVDPMQVTQSLNEEHLFYKGGPKAQVSLTAVLMYNSTSVLLLHSNTGLCRERRYSTDHFGTRKYSRNPVI